MSDYGKVTVDKETVDMFPSFDMSLTKTWP